MPPITQTVHSLSTEEIAFLTELGFKSFTERHDLSNQERNKLSGGDKERFDFLFRLLMQDSFETVNKNINNDPKNGAFFLVKDEGKLIGFAYALDAKLEHGTSAFTDALFSEATSETVKNAFGSIVHFWLDLDAAYSPLKSPTQHLIKKGTHLYIGETSRDPSSSHKNIVKESILPAIISYAKESGHQAAFTYLSSTGADRAAKAVDDSILPIEKAGNVTLALLPIVAQSARTSADPFISTRKARENESKTQSGQVPVSDLNAKIDAISAIRGR